MELVKPFLVLVFGVLLFLYYFNKLQLQGTDLAMGIIGFIIASYYIAAGILSVVLGSRMPVGLRIVFDILSVSLFPGFMFLAYLFVIINTIGMGPTGWTINILCMVASISLCVMYVVSRFAKSEVVVRLASLFGIIFVLALVCDMIFTEQGNSELLGTIEVVPVIAYAFYTAILLNSLKKEKAE